jgi:uncharacterized protein (TIGR02145 family)
MAENLIVSHFRNGDLIPLAKSQDEFIRLGEEKKPARYLRDGISDKKNTEYNWYAVNDPRGLAPAGWHIPHLVEWEILISIAGGKKNLKSTSGWRKDGNGTNLTGFDAKPRIELGDCGLWWTASEIKTTNSYLTGYAHMIDISWNIGRWGDYPEEDCYIANPLKVINLAVRCVKDVNE